MVSAGLLISLGSISIGGIVVRKILSKLNKQEEGNMIEIVTVSMIATTMLETYIKTKS